MYAQSKKKGFWTPFFFVSETKNAREFWCMRKAKFRLKNKMSGYRWKLVQIVKELVALIIDSNVKRICQKRTRENSCYQMPSCLVGLLVLEKPILKDGQQPDEEWALWLWNRPTSQCNICFEVWNVNWWLMHVSQNLAISWSKSCSDNLCDGGVLRRHW